MHVSNLNVISYLYTGWVSVIYSTESIFSLLDENTNLTALKKICCASFHWCISKHMTQRSSSDVPCCRGCEPLPIVADVGSSNVCESMLCSV